MIFGISPSSQGSRSWGLGGNSQGLMTEGRCPSWEQWGEAGNTGARQASQCSGLAITRPTTFVHNPFLHHRWRNHRGSPAETRSCWDHGAALTPGGLRTAEDFPKGVKLTFGSFKGSSWHSQGGGQSPELPVQTRSYLQTAWEAFGPSCTLPSTPIRG